MSKKSLTAWVRPLKDGHWQYFARCPESYVWGAAGSHWKAHDILCDFLYGYGYVEGWEIEEKRPYGKWAA